MCRENRERRIGIDRVKDTVEKRLQEENETILHYQQLMRELVNQVIIILIMCCTVPASPDPLHHRQHHGGQC